MLRDYKENDVPEVIVFKLHDNGNNGKRIEDLQVVDIHMLY